MVDYAPRHPGSFSQDHGTQPKLQPCGFHESLTCWRLRQGGHNGEKWRSNGGIGSTMAWAQGGFSLRGTEWQQVTARLHRMPRSSPLLPLEVPGSPKRYLTSILCNLAVPVGNPRDLRAFLDKLHGGSLGYLTPVYVQPGRSAVVTGSPGQWGE